MKTPHTSTLERAVFLLLIGFFLLVSSSACGSGSPGTLPTSTHPPKLRTSIPSPMPSSTIIPAVPIPVTPPEAPIPVEIPTWVAIGPWVDITSMVIDPLAPSVIYAGTDAGVFKSTDGGRSWRTVNAGLLDYNGFLVWDLVMDPLTPSTLYAALDGGVYKSIDSGESWSAVNNGLLGSSVSRLVIDPTSPETLYAVTRDQGIFRSTNAGDAWSESNIGLPGQNPATIALAIDPATPSTLYLGTYVGGVFKSTDAGGSWSLASSGLGETSDNPVDDLFIDPHSSSTIYALTRYKGVFRSINSGQYWIAFETGLDPLRNTVRVILIDRLAPATIYIGTNAGELYQSLDGGQSWDRLAAGLAGKPVTHLAFDPSHLFILYVGTYGGGIFTNQDQELFAPVVMPSLTAPPPALEASTAEASTANPLPATPSPTTGPASLPVLPPLEFPFRVSGTLNFRKPVQLPENARVMAFWYVVAADPQYFYIFGEGTIDKTNNSFEIVFDEPPPSAALNWHGSGALGVAIMFITADQSLLSNGRMPESFSPADILGASGQYGLIYVQGHFEIFETPGWWDTFDQGYSAGKGIEIPDSSFDGFEPIDPDLLEIIIDDFENIELVNWF